MGTSLHTSRTNPAYRLIILLVFLSLSGGHAQDVKKLETDVRWLKQQFLKLHNIYGQLRPGVVPRSALMDTSTGAGDMMKSTYDANNNGIVDSATAVSRVWWSAIQNKPSTFPPSGHSHSPDSINQDSTHRFVTDAQIQTWDLGGPDTSSLSSRIDKKADSTDAETRTHTSLTYATIAQNGAKADSTDRATRTYITTLLLNYLSNADSTDRATRTYVTTKLLGYLSNADSTDRATRTYVTTLLLGYLSNADSADRATRTFTNATYATITALGAKADSTDRETRTHTAATFAPIAQTMYIGTTSHAINRGSGSEALTGISSIDGSAATLTTARTINGASFNGSADIVTKDAIQAYQAGGSPLLAETMNFPLFYCNTSTNLADNTMRLVAVWLPKAATITGIRVYVRAQGNFTGDQNNKVGLFTYSGGTITLVASCTNDANIWKSAANGFATIAFSSTYAASAGLYFVGLLYNQSAQTTAPALAGGTALNNVAMATMLGTNSIKFLGTIGSMNDLPASQAMSGVTGTTASYWVGLY